MYLSAVSSGLPEKGQMPPRSADDRLRVLLVPDSIHWITGTIARAIVAHNSWIDGTIISGAVLDIVGRERPRLFEEFDIVHFVCPYASKRWLGTLHDCVPSVTSHHHVSDDWNLQRHNLDGDAIVVGSREWADDVVSRGAIPEKVVCVPYGVDAVRYIPATQDERASIRESLGIAESAIVVGFFAKRSSNERDRKGTDIFSAAARALAEKLPALVVLIIGPGWDEFISQLSAAGVRNVWIPFVRDSDRMPQMYQALDFYWVTARVEGGPVTLLEAMSAGVCCVTTPVGLAKEIAISGVNSIVAPFDDVRTFVEQTMRLSRDSEKRRELGTKARETMLETMDVPVTAQGVRRAYEIASEQFRARGNRDATSLREHHALDVALLRRIGILEQLIWAEALMLQGQRTIALRLIFDTWARHPGSTLPPRFLLRNVLPGSVVRSIMRVKASLRIGHE